MNWRRFLYIGLEDEKGRTVWFYINHWLLMDRATRGMWERGIRYRRRWPRPW